MSIETRSVVYEGPGGPFEGVIAWDSAVSGKRPVVLVSHNWMGQDDFDTGMAKRLAEQGYMGFAIDMFGQGKRATNMEEATALLMEVTADRAVLQARINAALVVAKQQPEADASKTAAFGFCLGGKCVLDLARSGADVLGVVSFHGLYDAPDHANKQIKAKVLILDGWDDPMATRESVIAIAKELTDANVDWQFHSYGHTGHSFTDPHANMKDAGMFYQQAAARRSWQSASNFLEEVFA